MATRFILTPYSAEFPSTNFPQLTIANTTFRRPVLAYDGTTAETAYWTAVAPQAIVSPYSLALGIIFPTATSGTAIMEVSFECISQADVVPDMDSSNVFGSANVSSSITARSTAGLLSQPVVSLTDVSSITQGDYVRISVARAPANASDTITTDLHLLYAEFRDST